MDYTLIIIALITAFPPTLMAYLSYRASKVNTEKLQVVKEEIQVVHATVNSRMTELLKSSKAESKAEGQEEERNRIE